jgi:tetratricopeptide (TPR) repeat protein
MERCGQMDSAGPSSTAHPLKRIAAVIVLLAGCALPTFAQTIPVIEQAKQLLSAERWQELAILLQSGHEPSADLDFYYGTALAHLGRWPEARAAFEAGRRLQPQDKRFPIELAGVAFKQKQYLEASSYLRRALQLDPSDAYANDFLATVYFLQGNLEAALKYWNRVDKPHIAEVQAEPTLLVDAALLDRAFAFAPASTLTLPQLLTSDVRVRGMGIFPNYYFDLKARDDGKFDIIFRARERDGWGHNKWEGLFLLFRGLPFQTIYPEFSNVGRDAINITSMFRWDAEKRRVSAHISGPFERKPKRRYNLALDLRSENWDIRNTFTGPAPLLGSFNLRREAIGGELVSFESGRWQWAVGGELSHRDFRSVIPGVALTPSLLARGYQLKQVTRIDAVLWRIPEQRLTLDAGASSQVGRIWSDPQHSFLKLQSSARLHWFPQPVGDDYEIQHELRAGKTLGDVPFDELYILGLERDNDLWMRAHVGTRDGRKGSAPLGRTYFLSNWEADKNIYSNGLVTVKLGPFVDTGKITDDSPALGSHKWLWDVGAQAKLTMFGAGIVFSYGKDLRSGNNAFYVSMLH